MCKKPQDSRFSELGSPRRVWAIPAIHGDVQRLMRLHDALAERFRLGDRLVYLGNYTGYGTDSAACIAEILTFRRMALAQPGVRATDIIYLRGRQEEMWQKLLQIQFAPNPTNVLLWMLGNGLAGTLQSYGISAHDGIESCRHGVLGLTRWTQDILKTIRKHAGHETFANAMTRAAFSAQDSAYPVLYVHAGLDTQKPLTDQGDSFWWSGDDFNTISAPYKPFEKVLRGYDPAQRGLHLNCVTATLDAGCGFGGKLVAAALDLESREFDLLEA